MTLRDLPYRKIIGYSLTPAIAAFFIVDTLAVVYTILSILGVYTMTWPRFAFWLVLLAITNIWFTILFLVHYQEYDLRTRLACLSWISTSFWYLVVSPLYYWSSMNVNSQQLAWVSLIFLWEVPVIGVGVYIGLHYWFFRSLHRYLKHDEKDNTDNDTIAKLYHQAVAYPRLMGLLSFVLSTASATLGGVQVFLWANWSLMEQVKNSLRGVFIAVFASVYFYLLLDLFLGPVRSELVSHLQYSERTFRHFTWRLVLLIATMVVGCIGMLAVVMFSVVQRLSVLVIQGYQVSSSQLSLVWEFIIGCSLTIFLTLGLTAFMAWSLSSAVRRLTELARHPDPSQPTLPIRFRTGDEVEMIAEAFQYTIHEHYLAKVHAERLDQIKSEFLSIASHQLRTPLTTMRWYCEILNQHKDELSSSIQKKIEVIEKNTRRMIHLVNDLLNVSRMEAGRLTINPLAGSIVDLLQQTVTDMQPFAKNNHCQLVFIIPSDKIPPILIDETVLSLVIRNLIDNAIQYSRPGSQIRVSAGLNEPDECVIEIRDQGIGISQQDLPHVFEKFYRAKKAIDLIPDGTGLGLYIVKKAIEMAGGRVWATSEVDKGTSINVALRMTGMLPQTGEVSLLTREV